MHLMIDNNHSILILANFEMAKSEREKENKKFQDS
mgnify:CR=1 FL=1